MNDITITFKREEAIYLKELVKKYKKYMYPNIRINTLNKLEKSIEAL